MKHFFILLTLCPLSLWANVRTMMYSDDFNRTTVNYNVIQNDDASVVMESNTLKLPCPKNGTAGRLQVIGATNSYQSPFRTQLDSIKADSLIWTWNMRQNYATSSQKLSGFASGKRGIAAVLLASDKDFTHASGYAVVQGGNSRCNYRLVRFTNGLIADANLTDIVASPDLTNPKYYMALKVVYYPATHRWRLYLDEGNSSAFVAPSDETPYVLCGEAEDKTFTDTKMSHFGWFMNYAGSVAFNMWIDNLTFVSYTDYTPEPYKPVKEHSLQLPNCISSHMIFQRNEPMRVWGWGSAEDTVVATFTHGTQTFTDSAIVNSEGKWLISLPAQPVIVESCSLQVHVVGTDLSKTITDVLVGDVWLAVGQSNMEKRMDHLTEYEEYKAEADGYPLIRYYRTGYNASTIPLDNAAGNPWFICNAANLDQASAVAYVFARRLQEQLLIPVGIVGGYRGGTELETWLSDEIINNDPELAFLKGRKATADPSKTSNYPSINHNGQLNPIKNFPVRGVIYYQGEGNIKRAMEFRFMLRKVAQDLRQCWQQPNLPFYYVQMFNVGPTSNGLYEEGQWQDLREQQDLLLHDPLIDSVGMAVIIETNEQSKNTDESLRMHPHTKKPVGERLAGLALHEVYKQDVPAYSPTMKYFYTCHDTMFIVMDEVGEGLAVRNDSSVLAGFVIRSKESGFVQAKAEILNDSVVAVHSDEVAEPWAVRYAWAKDPVCNLINSYQLPASPFRTDVLPSGAGYTAFPYKATASEDNTLVGIRVNGLWMKEFSNEQLSYTLPSMDELPYISAYVNHPTAKIQIEQMTKVDGSEAERTATITVTAESGAKRVFQLILPSKQTALQPLYRPMSGEAYDMLGRNIGNAVGQGIIIKNNTKIIQ